MISDTVLGAAVGVSGAVIGSLLTGAFNWLTTRQQVESQDDRRVGEFYLEKKVEALMEYHTQLDHFMNKVDIYKARAYNSEMSKDVASDDLIELFNSYDKSLHRVIVFLDTEQQKILEETIGPFRNSVTHVNTFTIEGMSPRPEDQNKWEAELHPVVEKKGQEAQEVVKQEIQQGLNRLESET